MEEQVCKNCGNRFQGKFCNNCGAKVYSDHDKSMHHFMHETFHFFTHLDNKFFKTLVLIIRKPAVLSVTYCEGIRDKYYKPVSLFFIGIILYLLFPLFGGLNMTFNYNMINLRAQHLDFIGDLAHNKALSQNISITTLAEKYDHMSPAIAKILLLIILPFTALILKLLFARKRKYFFDYLVLATEASCIIIYVNFLILPLVLITLLFILRYFGVTSHNSVGDSISIPVFFIYIIYWNTTALKRFFEISLTRALLKGFLFLILQSVVIFIIYRIILFLTVLLFI